MQRISILGVVVAGILDVMVSGLLGAIVVIAIVRPHLALGGPQNAEKMRLAIENSTAAYWTAMAIGTICSAAAGYVAAWIAKRHELLNGALSSWLCIGLAIPGLVTGTSGVSWELQILAMLLSPVVGALGGYLRMISRRA